MENVLKYLSDIRVVIAIGAIVVLLVIWFICQKLRADKFHRQLEDLEVRYNSIKSVPLSFKLNKAVAISRVEPEAMQKVATMKDDFDKCEANLKQIAQALADTEDAILAGKLKKVKNDIADVEASIVLGEKQVSSLDGFLDTILEKETQQRQEVTELKNRFRDLKQKAGDNRSQLSYIWPSIENGFTQMEKMFSSFEEWMYASDFEKASNELQQIRTSLDTMEKQVNGLPEILNDARGVIPKLAEVLHHDYTAAHDRGVYMKHLQVEKNLTVITSGLKEDLEALKEGNCEDVRAHLNDYKTRLQQLTDQVKEESDAYDALKKLATETTMLYDECEENAKYCQERYNRMSTRFNLSAVENKLKTASATLKTVASRMPRVFGMYQENSNPASSLTSSMKELNQDFTSCNASLKEVRAQIDEAVGAEDRARKQLVKLQIIMCQMQQKINKFKLPSISDQYEEDLRTANEYIRRLKELIDATPLNVNIMNSTLKEAIDYIYKLYNNVTNVVATSVMTENTIVFGNRYRSTYSDIDSELTRSELSFRNGDYTTALTIAIAIMEKINPGNYEKMIKENAKSAA